MMYPVAVGTELDLIYFLFVLMRCNFDQGSLNMWVCVCRVAAAAVVGVMVMLDEGKGE